MLKQVYKIDSNGFYIEPVIIQDNEPIPSNCVEEMPIKGLYKPKQENGKWVEGLTLEEIEAVKNQPQPPNEIEQLKKQQADLVFELMMKGVL